MNDDVTLQANSVLGHLVQAYWHARTVDSRFPHISQTAPAIKTLLAQHHIDDPDTVHVVDADMNRIFPSIVTGTDMLIDGGTCPECFSSQHLWWFAEAPIGSKMYEGVIYCTDPDFSRVGEDGKVVMMAWRGDYIAPAKMCPHNNDLSESPCQECDEA